MRRFFLYVIITICCSCSHEKKLTAFSAHRVEVLIIGGGASGIAAGLQSARLGANTLIAEETTWLGGMITSAGVSAFDGNHNLPSGIWAEFRQKLYEVYGGPQAVATGWVSNTLFEPHVGDSIFKSMAAAERQLQVKYGWVFEKVLSINNRVAGAIFREKGTGEHHSVYANQTIDATEYGDVLANAGAAYSVGLEAGSITGEDAGVTESSPLVQDITYVATLKDYGPAADCTIAKPAGYNPLEFDGCCINYYSSNEKIVNRSTASQMLEYGKLPNGKYMINWPARGNDIYLNVVEMAQAERAKALEAAKQKTLRFVYFLQKQLAFKNLGIAWDEFPTNDGLPLIAYHRESRRVQGIVRFTQPYIQNPFAQSNALYRTGIAVGDYPIDHHHRENPKAPQHLSFQPIPSYNIPLGALIPLKANGLIAAEKSISVSNIVNGTTRLQPVVLLIGQAAGTLAALASTKKINARDVAVRAVQEALLKSGAYLMPYFDVKPSHPQFIAIQKAGATGLLRGKGEPYQWANRTWFYPDSAVATHDFFKALKEMMPAQQPAGEWLTAGESITLVKQLQPLYANITPSKIWEQSGLQHFDAERKITRAELAALLNQTVKPFERFGVSHKGAILSAANGLN